MQHSALLVAMIAATASLARATPVIETVAVNTSSLAGTTGSLDFQFDPGPLVSQSAFAQILNFTTNGAVVPGATLTGDVSGSLPGTLTFDNGTTFNDYFQDFTFGASLQFQVSLYGPALSAPDGASSSGSTFAFSLFSDLAGTIPALTTDTTDGFAYEVNVNLDGSTTVSDYLVSQMPEPGTLLLVGSLLSFAALYHIYIYFNR